jgi:opacity protein-like surface antigen
MRILAALLLTVVLPVTALAQDPKRRLEFTLYGGANRAGGMSGNYVEGAAFGGSVEIRRFSRIGFTARIQRLNHSGTINDETFSREHTDVEGHALDASGGIVYHFTSIHFEPFVAGGVGLLHSDRSERSRIDEQRVFVRCLPDCSSLTVLPGSVGAWEEQVQSKVAFHAGAGIYIPLTSKLFVRPEFRFVGAKDLHFMHAMLGLSYRR